MHLHIIFDAPIIYGNIFDLTCLDIAHHVQEKELLSVINFNAQRGELRKARGVCNVPRTRQRVTIVTNY